MHWQYLGGKVNCPDLPPAKQQSLLCLDNTQETLSNAASRRQVLPRDFFNVLRTQKGAGFEAFIREHVIPFEADMDKPLLGIAPDMLTQLHEQVRLIPCLQPPAQMTVCVARLHAYTFHVAFRKAPRRLICRFLSDLSYAICNPKNKALSAFVLPPKGVLLAYLNA